MVRFGNNRVVVSGRVLIGGGEWSSCRASVHRPTNLCSWSARHGPASAIVEADDQEACETEHFDVCETMYLYSFCVPGQQCVQHTYAQHQFTFLRTEPPRSKGLRQTVSEGYKLLHDASVWATSSFVIDRGRGHS